MPLNTFLPVFGDRCVNGDFVRCLKLASWCCFTRGNEMRNDERYQLRGQFGGRHEGLVALFGRGGEKMYPREASSPGSFGAA
jgi:hypothetical protein